MFVKYMYEKMRVTLQIIQRRERVTGEFVSRTNFVSWFQKKRGLKAALLSDGVVAVFVCTNAD